MTSKARSLRERMSIDPDAPTPVAERRARTVPPAEPEPAEPEPAEPEPAEPAPVEPAPVEPGPVEPGPSVTAPADALGSAETDVPSGPARATRPRAPSRRAPARRGGGRRSAREGVDWETAVDDPSISPGSNGYRSFYVSDEVFARFRAAVYWTARRPDADDVPDNMSAGVEDYMEAVATDLERRYNDRGVFPPTPDQVRAHRRREGRS